MIFALGPIGFPGARGPQGLQGNVGEAGIKGQQGNVGERGIKGKNIHKIQIKLF